MGIVKVMSHNLANKIAAGEVVETLMNVVKELVENSIDAGAQTIEVELIDSGIKGITVRDDGVGMIREDAINALKRHATSKIYTDEDLFSIHTLGFRGEALPSIASVSKMQITTATLDEGTILDIDSGEIIKISDAPLRRGTEIIVKDLFYNTPARLKYLKSLYTELSNIVFYLNRMALANPNIKFLLKNSDKVLLNTDGSGNLLKVIYNIYGIEVAKKMMQVETSSFDYEINGYISYPEVNRSNRNYITILVNHRSVRNLDLNRTIIEAYHTYLPKDRYPIVILDIAVDPSIIDVNIHPTKMDIKFSKMESLEELITNMIKSALEKLVLIPEAKYEDRPVANISKVEVGPLKDDFKKEEVTKPIFSSLEFDFSTEHPSIKEEEVKYDSLNNLSAEVTDSTSKEIDIKQERDSDNKFKMIEPLALVHGTYIIGENEDGMYIMDQHAVNERINYEYYKEAMGKDTKETIDLLVPIKLELSNSEYIIVKNHFNLLEELGFSFEEFGFNSLLFRSHPYWLGKDRTLEKIRKIIDVILLKEDFSKEKFNEQIAITLACKMSIKANEHISLEEMRELIKRLKNTKNPYTCPHGRPTIIFYSKYELEKMFKRVM